MKYFEHLYIPEQVIPALGIQTSGLVRKLINHQRKAQDYVLEKILGTLGTQYLENEEKHFQVNLLME